MKEGAPNVQDELAVPVTAESALAPSAREDGDDPDFDVDENGAYPCDKCEKKCKTQFGLAYHKKWRHGDWGG